MKIINMAICTPPHKLSGEAKLLATFGVIVWPMVANNLRLVQHKGEIKIWMPTQDVRFLSEAKPLIIKAAMETARNAIDDMGELVD
jgi:hypothetical protein